MNSCQKEEKLISKSTVNKDYDKFYSTADTYMSNQQFDSAFYYYNKAKSVCDESKNFDQILSSLLRMAYIQQIEGDYASSETTATEAIFFFQKDTDPAYKCSTYNILGINYENTYDYESAISHYNRALKLTEIEFDKTVLKNNIAVVHIAKEEYQKAITILLPLSLDKNVFSNANHYARVLDNLGYCYFKTDNPKALDYINQALAIRKREGNTYGLATSYLHLSELYQNTNQKLATTYAQLAYKTATKNKSVDNRTTALALLIKNTQGIESRKFSLLHLNLSDSINKVRQKAKNQFAKIRYDSKIEKAENIYLKTQKIKDALQIEKQKNKNLILYFLIGIAVLFSSFIFYYLTDKNKRQLIKNSYITEIRIAKKLHDELANDVYQTMAFAETQDLSLNKNKEVLLTNLDIIYSRTRNISRENSSIETGISFVQNLKEMLSGYNSSSVNILINGIDTVPWSHIDQTKKITVFRCIQELLVNMKKHSKCTLVVLTFNIIENKIQIDYSDNGVGASLDQLNLKNGLLNVENRILAIKGTITFDLKSNKGFKTTINFPI
ncbi:tetratricopeptide repeat-containing sensor histidine kinase [Flavobacterium sp. PL11]|uniref:tetratricopeptide repeat-containing sensor histidine kinase n=1 Tax=Flavobacterium sp. PL11 TaxID=3071717 RepID=UPI002E1029E1